MAKSLRKHLTDAADLTAIAGLTMGNIVDVSVGCCGLTFHLQPLELARVSRLFEIPRKSIAFREGKTAFHIDFTARGAKWVACVLKEDHDAFNDALGAGIMKRLAVEPPKLAAPAAKRLTHAKPPTLFGDH